jgi:excisionase family DNA binding protein
MDYKHIINEPFYTVKSLCSEYGLKAPTVHQWVRTRKLESYRIGNMTRIPATEWERFITDSNKARVQIARQPI